jgi:hypothetical protein
MGDLWLAPLVHQLEAAQAQRHADAAEPTPRDRLRNLERRSTAEPPRGPARLETLADLRHLLGILTGRRLRAREAPCKARLLAVVAMLGYGTMTLRHALAMSESDLRQVRLPAEAWPHLSAWHRWRRRCGHGPTDPWLCSWRSGKPVRENNVQRDLARIGRLVGTRLGVRQLRQLRPALPTIRMPTTLPKRHARGGKGSRGASTFPAF